MNKADTVGEVMGGLEATALQETFFSPIWVVQPLI
jgi:hypothetical protein